jgi:hypothetical protein
MKKLQQLLSTLLLSLLFLCFFEKANGQCIPNNQYLVALNVNRIAPPSSPIALEITSNKLITTFRRVDFRFGEFPPIGNTAYPLSISFPNGSVQVVNLYDMVSYEFDNSGKQEIRIVDQTGLSATFEFEIRELSVSYIAPDAVRSAGLFLFPSPFSPKSS